MPTTSTITVHLDGDPVPVTVGTSGQGRPVVLLHGGAGPASVSGLAERLGDTFRVVTPVLPGFAGTPRPDRLDSARTLGVLVAALLDHVALDDVVLVGSSLGGWVAAETALTGSPRVTAVVLLDAVGLDVPGHPVTFDGLTPQQVAQRSYHDPERFFVDPATLPEAVRSQIPGNLAALSTYMGPHRADVTLTGRLAACPLPVLVLWGESDGIVDTAHGRAWAAAVPGGRLHVIPRAGHLPQIEAPERVVAQVLAFLSARPR